MLLAPLLVIALAAQAAGAGVSGAQGAGSQAAPVPEPVAADRPLTEFAGTWEYNEDLSVNAATGRPESARAVNDRRGIGRGPVGISGASTMGSRRGSAGIPTAGGSALDGVFSLYIAQRDTRRDLLEIAPQLRLGVSDAAVTVVDDLDRSLTFPLDGRRRKYQLGAAVFDASTTWDAGQLKTSIEGPDGLEMSQTWFLSADGTKLFLVIRVGRQEPGGRAVGVNRVYDRVAP